MQTASVWARVAGGWAINLDGSDAAATFSLPRLELRESARGWRSVCLLANGTMSERAGDLADSLPAAKAAALAQAGRMLGPAHAAALGQVPAR
jgi:hypothetical protein